MPGTTRSAHQTSEIKWRRFTPDGADHANPERHARAKIPLQLRDAFRQKEIGYRCRFRPSALSGKADRAAGCFQFSSSAVLRNLFYNFPRPVARREIARCVGGIGAQLSFD